MSRIVGSTPSCVCGRKIRVVPSRRHPDRPHHSSRPAARSPHDRAVTTASGACPGRGRVHPRATKAAQRDARAHHCGPGAACLCAAIVDTIREVLRLLTTGPQTGLCPLHRVIAGREEHDLQCIPPPLPCPPADTGSARGAVVLFPLPRPVRPGFFARVSVRATACRAGALTPDTDLTARPDFDRLARYDKPLRTPCHCEWSEAGTRPDRDQMLLEHSGRSGPHRRTPVALPCMRALTMTAGYPIFGSVSQPISVPPVADGETVAGVPRSAVMA